MRRNILLLAMVCLLWPITVCAQTVYYNTEGGRYYHADPHCDSISEQYWNSMAEITQDQAQQIGLKGPCERCFRKEAASMADEAGGPEESILAALVTLEYSQEDRVFYEACFENARQKMPDPDRSDPEYVYRNQAKHSQEASGGERKWLAKMGGLYDLAADDDIPRGTSILIGYAALEQLAQIPRTEMDKYYADAWMNISDPEQRIWQVHMNLAADYRRMQPDADAYIVYIDAGTGEILDVTKY